MWPNGPPKMAIYRALWDNWTRTKMTGCHLKDRDKQAATQTTEYTGYEPSPGQKGLSGRTGLFPRHRSAVTFIGEGGVNPTCPQHLQTWPLGTHPEIGVAAPDWALSIRVIKS